MNTFFLFVWDFGLVLSFFFFLNFKLIVFQTIIIKFAVQLTCNKHY